MSKMFTSKEKHAARKLLKHYVKTGRIDRGLCEYANCCDPNTEAHHPDYNFPLDVIWLCRNHHLEIHRYIRPIEVRR